MSVRDKNILVAVSGGIAAFKAVELVRELGRRGARVKVALTPNAARFVGPVTFTGLTGEPALIDLWDASYPGELHVVLAEWAHAIVVAPATANLLARAAQGMADDLVLATLACAACPVLIAPAMHERMWLRPATQRNVEQLQRDGLRVVGPTTGKLANGKTGQGRMAEPNEIANALDQLLAVGGDLTNAQMASRVSFDSATGTYSFNSKQMATSDENSGLMTNQQAEVTANSDPKKGIKVSDPTTGSDFTMMPRFGLTEGKRDGNRIVYPLTDGKSGWTVYSLHAVGSKEDIVLTKSPGKTASFDYDLSLGDSKEARIEADGSIGIYGNSLLSANVATGSDKDAKLLEKARKNAPKDTKLFSIPAPTIIDGNGASSAEASFSVLLPLVYLRTKMKVGPQNN